MKEEADETPERTQVSFRLVPRPGDHVRHAGEDVRLGDSVLARGTRVGPGEIGLLAALGRTVLRVHRAPEVAIVSTGDELVPVDQALGPGQIVGSNGHALYAQVLRAGGRPRFLPICPDDRARLRETFAEALLADVVLSSGGVSVGEFDYVKEVLADLGVRERFWQVAMKPGKPLSFGTLDSHGRAPKLVFGLPGNPASSMVSFELFVRPALLRAQGLAGAALYRPTIMVRLLAPAPQDRKRLHFVRARVFCEGAEMCATPIRQQGSGMLRSMVGVNALLEIPAGDTPLKEEALVRAHLLTDL